MNKNDIIRFFADATDEQVKSLLDINSADITKALNKQKDGSEKLQADLDAANAALDKANETIKALEANKGDLEKVQKELADYKAAEEKRIADEKAAAEHAELMERMEAVLGDRKFTHERLKDIVAEDFAKALQDKANRGKSDADVFDAITRDQGYFASQNPSVNMPKFNTNTNTPEVKDKASFLKLGFNEQMKFKAEHPNEFKQMFGMPQ